MLAGSEMTCLFNVSARLYVSPLWVPDLENGITALHFTGIRLCRLAHLLLLDGFGSGSTEGQGTGPSWVLGSCDLLGQRGSIPFLGHDAVALGPSGQGWHLAVWGAVLQRCSSSGITPMPLKLWAWGSTSRQAAVFI